MKTSHTGSHHFDHFYEGGFSPALKRRMLLAALVLLMVVAGVTWKIVDWSHNALIETKAVDLAEVVARQGTVARSVYTEHVVGKLAADQRGQASESYAGEPGNIPLPAQFLKLTGQRASAENAGLYSLRLVSKWNLGEGQGIQDDFQAWAWQELEAQDQAQPTGPIDWRPAWRTEIVNGQRTLRFLKADPGNGVSCINCHNALEKSASVRAIRTLANGQQGKQWHRYQLLGALEVQVPLAAVEAMAKTQRRNILLVVLGLTLTGLTVMGVLILADNRRSRDLARDLAYQASHDKLTGLMNRPQFECRLAALLESARSDGSAHGLMFLDLDQFKVVNDTCGHQAGDELLRQLGERFRASLRASDTLARLGGDEFGVVVHHCDQVQAMEIADKLLKITSEFRFSWDRRIFEIGVSIGLVILSKDSESVAALMSAADLACYGAKESGRNRIKVYSDDDGTLRRSRDDMSWGERITSALAEGRMKLALQSAEALRPELKVRRYQEVLLRMFDTQGNPVPIGPVIAAAERYNLMSSKLDRWVLETTCAHIRAGRLKASSEHIVAINISGGSLGDEGFHDFAQRTLATAGIPAGALCFEVTETAAIGHLTPALKFMERMRELGCLFALDDFGSGLSSFGYLKTLPVDFLKLDGAFVRDILVDRVDRAMVNAIHSVGRSIGIPTIAEWVETAAIRDELREMGIDYAQGYAVHKPTLIDGQRVPDKG